MWSSLWGGTLRHIQLKETHICLPVWFGLSAPACYVRMCHMAVELEDRIIFTAINALCPKPTLLSSHIFSLLLFFLPLLLSYQKGLLLLLSVSDSTSLLFQHFDPSCTCSCFGCQSWEGKQLTLYFVLSCFTVYLYTHVSCTNNVAIIFFL